MTARERLELLFDPGVLRKSTSSSTQKYGVWFDKMELPADGVVTGIGKSGRPVAAFCRILQLEVDHWRDAKKIMKDGFGIEDGDTLIGINDWRCKNQEGVDPRLW